MEEKDKKIQELEKTILELRKKVIDLQNQLHTQNNRSNRLWHDEHEYNVDDGSNYDH